MGSRNATFVLPLLVPALVLLASGPSCTGSDPSASVGATATDGGTADGRATAEASVPFDAGPPRSYAGPGAPVVTHHNDNYRTGLNPAETLLSPKTVSQQTFGLAFSRPVKGYIYAQPLFVPQLTIGGRTRDVVFVATEHDDAYAFDAENSAEAEPLWHVSFGPSIPSTDLDDDQGSPYRDIIPELGVTSTPVIDLARQTIYFFAQSKEAGAYPNRLHALDILTGAERPGSPVEIVVSAKGTGDGSTNGVVTIPPKFVLQRPALAVDRGTLWIVGGGHGDFGPYHGWLLAFDQETLKLRGTYMSTPDGWAGGIWQSGGGPVIDDDGAVYVETGNGTYNATKAVPDLSESFLKVKLGPTGLSLVDWFTPFNHVALDNSDADLGSTGPMLMPGTKLVIGGGKEGRMYVLDRGSMGHVGPTSDAVVQSFLVKREMFTTPAYWESTKGSRVYVLPRASAVAAYKFLGDRFEVDPYMQTPWVAPIGVPGGALSVSANGKDPASGIVWVLGQADPNMEGYETGNAALHAFDADDLSKELYDSTRDPADAVGEYVKFTVPTVTGGRVFVGTASDRLRVYALRK